MKLVVGLDPKLLRRRVHSLPALPQAVNDVLQAFNDEGASLQRCADSIGRDQALAARTLRLANCSFYGVAGRVRTVRDALSVLGVRTVGTMVATVAVTGSMAVSQRNGFDFVAFWRHALGTALAARALSARIELDADTAFIAGLLHDIGRLVLASHFPDELAAVMALHEGAAMNTLEAEQAVLGIDHAAIGAMVASHWHLPSEVVSAIAGHHQPPNSAQAALPDAVHLADAISHALDLAGSAQAQVPPVDLGAWHRVGLDGAAYHAVFAATELQCRDACAALNL